MLPYLASLGFAAVIWAVARRLRSLRLKEEKDGTVVVATVVSVSRESGVAFGGVESWDDVVGQFTDEDGRVNVVTKSGPGSPWKPAVGTVFHVVCKRGEVENRRRGVVGSVVRITYASGATGTGLIVEAEMRQERFFRWLAAAIAVGTVAWAIASSVV